MPLAKSPVGYRFHYSNVTALNLASAVPTVTPTTSDANPSGWTNIVTAANCTADVYRMFTRYSGGGVNGLSKCQTCEIGYDPTNTSTYISIIPEHIMGGSPAYVQGWGQNHKHPFYIPAGSQIGMRMRGANATPGTVGVEVNLFGDPSRPVWAARKAHVVGALTGSLGVSVPSGNTTAYGTLTTLGTSSAGGRAVQLCAQQDLTSCAVKFYFGNLYVSDGTNNRLIQTGIQFSTTTTNETFAMPLYGEQEVHIPAGASLKLEVTCATAGEAGLNFQAIVYE